MKITAFNGSPWGQQGHTHIITQNFLAGASGEGAKAQIIQLIEKKIKPCKNCGACFYKTPGKCAIKDDMETLIKKFMASDVVLFASPVYLENVTSLMKTFIERLMPILEPHYEMDENGEYRHRKRFEIYPEIMVISSCAMPEQGNFQVLELFFRRLARALHTKLVGEIYRSYAGLLLLCREVVQFRPLVKQYTNLLHLAGSQFAQTGRISPEMQVKLHQPLIDPDQYIEYANSMWDKILPKQKTLQITR
ncbi:MAG: flavodoxin family protein [Planctomycetes bacterium]|nr:flavodoxin family protein [Planctomycetota bacterium]